MKTLTTVMITLALASATLGAQAEDRDAMELAICAADVKAHYGNDTQIRLVSRQRGLYGTQLKVAASMDADNAVFAGCWVALEDLDAREAEFESEQVAAVVKPVE